MQGCGHSPDLLILYVVKNYGRSYNFGSNEIIGHHHIRTRRHASRVYGCVGEKKVLQGPGVLPCFKGVLGEIFGEGGGRSVVGENTMVNQ